MSFVGLWLPARPTAARALEPALSRLAAAGPKPAIYRAASQAGDVAFGYVTSLRERQLHTPPEQLAAGLSIVGDVRLDNRTELAEALAAPLGQSDSLLILRAYQRWGQGCAARLLGDFAFGIWDSRANELLLIRDACGVRPLFYVARADCVAFASRADALLAVPGISAELDERAVVDYLAELPEDEARTVFAAVRRVPPASSLCFGAGEPRLREYFDVADIRPLRLSSDSEYREALSEALRRSVARRATLSAESGVLLSGGLDSTTVTCLAAEARQRSGQSALYSFSAIFPKLPRCNERQFQRSVVTHCQTAHTEVAPEPHGPSGRFASLVKTFGDPAPIGGHWLAWPIAEAAASRGVSVLLTGIDGDRVVSHGGALFTELARSRQWTRLARECLTASDFSMARKLRVLSSQLAQAFIPVAVLRQWDTVDPRKRRRFADSLRFIRHARLKSCAVPERMRQLSWRVFDTREAHIRSLKASDRNWDVELLDRLGATAGVEFRHPFFDREVLALCVSLPGDQKRREGMSRYVLRQAMASFAPRRVYARKNHTALDEAFRAWARAWLSHEWQRQPGLDNLSTWVDVPRVESEVRDLLAGSGRMPVDFLWRCVVFSRWLEYV